jgi:Tfp pilus assembly protein PilO
MNVRYIDEPLPLRILALSMIIASYFCIYRPIELQRANLAIETQSTHEHIALAQDALRHAHDYAVVAASIRHELGNLRTEADTNQQIPDVLVDLDHAAQQRALQLTGLDPQHTQSASDAIGLTVHVRGHYGDILHFIGDLAMTRSLVDVQSIEFVRDEHEMHEGEVP